VAQNDKAGYNRLLLLVAGLGGLLYGVDVGIIAGALPYLEATSGLNAGQLSIVVAAVLLGSVISTLFAGALADWIGRKPLMMLSGLLFVCSIPIIALSHGYQSLVLGRLLQGISAGLIGVVVPLYLAECLSASSRGKGTGIFQWLLTLGIVYEKSSRFAGGAYSSFLKKVDRFSERTLAASLREREGFASRLVDIDAQTKRIIATLKTRGFKSPYLRNYVVARINPVRFHKSKKGDTKPPMPLAQALTRMAAAVKNFKVDSVSNADLAWVAVGAGATE